MAVAARSLRRWRPAVAALIAVVALASCGRVADVTRRYDPGEAAARMELGEDGAVEVVLVETRFDVPAASFFEPGEITERPIRDEVTLVRVLAEVTNRTESDFHFRATAFTLFDFVRNQHAIARPWQGVQADVEGEEIVLSPGAARRVWFFYVVDGRRWTDDPDPLERFWLAVPGGLIKL